MEQETRVHGAPAPDQAASQDLPASEARVTRPAGRPSRGGLLRILEVWEHPLWSGLLALVVYGLITVAFGSFNRVSPFPYYTWLADAFLHGRLDLVRPAQVHDLSLFNGHYYLYWGPFPALLLMPFVAALGRGLSDMNFTTALGAVDVALVALLLRQSDRRQVAPTSALQRSLLVLFFAFGTVMMTLAPFGRVWFTGELVGFTGIALAYLAALTFRGPAAFFLTGLALACAMLTRNHLVLAGLWPAYHLLVTHWTPLWRRLPSLAVVGVLPLVIALGALGVYDWLRFGNPLDNGLAYHNMDARFRDDFRRYGAFSLHYVPANLFYQYVAYPFPKSDVSYEGGSLFLLSPVFLAAFWGLAAGRPRRSAYILLATVALVAIPILLLMGTGWVQIGPRYTLDFMVPLLLLTAMGVRRWPGWALAATTALSIIQYLAGLIYLGSAFKF